MKYMALIGQAVSEEKMFEHCGRCQWRRRTPEHGYNQRTSGPVNAHLISGPSISINHTKPD